MKAAVILAKKVELLVQAGSVDLVSINQLLTPIVAMLETLKLTMPIPFQDSVFSFMREQKLMHAESLKELIKPLLLTMYQQLVKSATGLAQVVYYWQSKAKQVKDCILQFATHWDMQNNNDAMYHYFRKGGLWTNYVEFVETMLQKTAYGDPATLKNSIVVTKLQALTYFGDLKVQAAGLLSRIDAL